MNKRIKIELIVVTKDVEFWTDIEAYNTAFENMKTEDGVEDTLENVTVTYLEDVEEEDA